MIGLGIAVGAGSFLLMFATALALFRFEYGMPTALSTAVSFSVVLIGFLFAMTVQMTGIASLTQAAGGIATFLLTVASALAVVS